MMNRLRTLIAILLLGNASVFAVEIPDGFPSGRYNISMVYNSADKSQKYIDSYQQQVWIELTNDSISIVQVEKLYTPVFGEGDSMEVTMELAGTEETRTRYKIIGFTAKTDSNGNSYNVCKCKTDEAEECEFLEGVIGSTNEGNPVYCFNFSDSNFKDIYWCYVAEDINPDVNKESQHIVKGTIQAE